MILDQKLFYSHCRCFNPLQKGGVLALGRPVHTNYHLGAASLQSFKSEIRPRLQKAGEVDMALAMRFMEHLVIAVTGRLRANFRLVGKVSLISLFRMIDSD